MKRQGLRGIEVSCILAKWTGIILCIFAFQAGPLFAAEGTAHLTFQKTAPKKEKTQTYIIRKGDSITRIVRRLGAEVPNYQLLKKLNPHIPDLNKIYPGQKLILVFEGEEKDAALGEDSVRTYSVKKGDSLRRIIIFELHADPADMVKLLQSVRRLNPEVADLNRIFPGQTLKIPEARARVEVKKDLGPLTVEAPPPPVIEKPAPEKVSLPPEATLSLLKQIITKLNGSVHTSGSYYIPLPGSGQITIDCAAIPVVELDDGTTILLDFAGRLSDDVMKIIRQHWQNHHFVKMDGKEEVGSVLQKIVAGSKSYAVTKGGAPLLIAEEPQVGLLPDWLILRKEPSGRQTPLIGLFFAAETSQLLPRPILAQARRRAIDICEILVDKMQAGVPEWAAKVTPVPRLPGKDIDEFLPNFFAFFGFEAVRGSDVQIFTMAKDGYDLSIRSEWIVRSGNRSAFLHANPLPPQFIEVLKKRGLEPVHLAPEASKKSMMEGVLSAFGIPHQFALFSLPQDKSAKFVVSFPALKIDSPRGQFYFIEFDLDSDSYELFNNHWKLNILRY